MSRQTFNLQSYLDDNLHDDRYLLTSEIEIRTLLNHLKKNNNHVTGHLDNSNDIFSTCVLEVEANHLIIDGVSDEALSNRILECSQLQFSSFHAGVPVLFNSPLIATCPFDGAMTFTIPMPAEVLWRQRREFFRVPVPMSKPALCEMDLKTGQIARNPLSDISVGGLGLMMSASSAVLNRGLQVGGCQITLPGFGTLTSDIRVCNESLHEFGNSGTVKRYGCQFVNLQPRDQSLLQRYVIRLESDMHATHVDV